jgi:hypothetical protein
MKTKRFFSVLACAAFAVTMFSSCDKGKDEPAQETGISLPAKSKVDQGSTITLRATSIPNGEVTTVEKWESADPSVATVEDGKVKGVMIGTTTITATKGEFTAECEVTVDESLTASAEGSNYYVMVLENYTYNDLKGEKVDLRVNGASGGANRAWDIYVTGETFIGGTNMGKSFFDVNEDGQGRWYNLIKTDATNWAGGGISILNDPASTGDNYIDMTDIAAHRNDYVLHIGLKTEHTFDILIRFQDGIHGETAAGFVIGKDRVLNNEVSYSHIVGDFPRDGKWHKIEIPFRDFPEGFYADRFQGGQHADIGKTPYIFELIVGDVQTGTQIEFDAVFFYKPKKK